MPDKDPEIAKREFILDFLGILEKHSARFEREETLFSIAQKRGRWYMEMPEIFVLNELAKRQSKKMAEPAAPAISRGLDGAIEKVCRNCEQGIPLNARCCIMCGAQQTH